MMETKYLVGHGFLFVVNTTFALVNGYYFYKGLTH